MEYKYLPIINTKNKTASSQLFVFIPFSLLFMLFGYFSVDKIIRDSMNDALSSALYNRTISTDNSLMVVLAIIFFTIGTFILTFSLKYYFNAKAIEKQIEDRKVFVGLKVNNTEIIDYRINIFKIKQVKILKADINSIDCRMYKGSELVKITYVKKIAYLRPAIFGLSGNALIQILK